MRFTIRPGESTASGGFAVIAQDAREALNHVRDMLDRGLTDIDVVDPEGRHYDLIELERITAESEAREAS
ncbi:hypothetical protein [Enterovirga aerilata]|uniref:Uncharacterized protein n=1 Tax=Enterovirga aerilata TaxID=2730920 RepID=A0A849HV77_9HYPH|nr:hypothetical protein [Enterovirga sp. DB1703]NNM71416.1 hypothetical protein [Enterovirga sp. DB1703]